MRSSSPLSAVAWAAWAIMSLCSAFAYAVDWHTIYYVFFLEWMLTVSTWIGWASWSLSVGLTWLGLRQRGYRFKLTSNLLLVTFGLVGVAFAFAHSFAKDEGLVWIGATEFVTRFSLGVGFAAFNSGLVLAAVFLYRLLGAKLTVQS